MLFFNLLAAAHSVISRGPLDHIKLHDKTRQSLPFKTFDCRCGGTGAISFDFTVCTVDSVDSVNSGYRW